MAFPRRGITAGGGCATHLSRIVGLGRALELVLTTDAIDAQEAYRIGLVNKVVPHEQLMSEAMKMATRIAELPEYAVLASKMLVMKAANIPWQEDSILHWLCNYLLITDPATQVSHIEGAKQFVEKRGRDAIGTDAGHTGKKK